MQKLQRVAIHEGEQKLIEKLRSEGTNVVELSPAEYAKFMERGKSIWNQFPKQIPPALIQEIMDIYKANGKTY